MKAFFSALLLSAGTLLAEVTPLSSSTEATLFATALTNAGAIHHDFTKLEGSEAVTITNFPLSDGSNEIAVADGFFSSRSFTVRSEGSFLRHHFSVTAKLSPSALTDTIDTISTEGHGEAEFVFEVTGEAMKVNFGFDTVTFGTPIVSLENETGPIFQYPNADNSTGFTGTLPPGTYTLSVSAISFPETTASIVSAAFAATVTIGEEPHDVPLPVAGSYTHPAIVSEHSGEGILAVESPQILSEVDLGNGFHQLEVTASVHNLYACPWPEVSLTVAEEHPDGPNLEILTPLRTFSLAPNELGGPASGSSLLIQVASTELEALRAQILDATRFQTSGLEQPVFKYPVKPLEAEDFPNSPADHPAGAALAYDFVPLIPSGFTIVEWESYYQVPRVTIINDDGPVTTIAWQQGVDRYFPLTVADIERDGTTFLLSFHEDSTTLPEVMKDGKLTTTLTPEGHPEDWGVTNVPETRNTSSGFGLTGFFPAPIPFHFNEVELPGGIRFSGSLGFQPELIEVELDMRDASIRNLITRARWRADCNLLLETSEGADNSAEPIASQESTLLELSLFSLQLPAGFSFNPQLELSAGAILTAPTSLSLPITGGFIADLSAGIQDGTPFTDGSLTEVPLHVSDPGLYEALGITASAWLDCEVKALIGIGEGLANTGPTLGVRAQADFDLLPLADPWWTIDASLSAFAGVEFDLLGLVEIIDAEQTVASMDLFNLAADGPLSPLSPANKSLDPQPAFLPLGDPETRWARSLFTDLTVPNGSSFATQLADGSILTGQGSTGGFISKLSSKGEHQWTIDTTVQLAAMTGVALPDNTFTVLGSSRFDFRIATFDSDGTLLWHKGLAAASGGPGIYQTHDLLHYETADGDTEYFFLGQAFSGGLDGFQLMLVKADATGTPLWAKAYQSIPLDGENTDSIPGDFCLTADGDILIAASTNADLPNVASSISNINRNGHVLKIDGETGTPLWSTLIGSGASPQYSAISEGPDGSIYVGGQASPSVRSDLPSMILTKLNPDGSLIDSALIGTVAGQALPIGGESLYDNIQGMTWADGNLWVCGQSGIYNAGGVGGTAQGSSAFTAMISPDLNVSRFVYHATPSSDSFHTIEATEKGLLISGYSTSFSPWPLGAGREGTTTSGSLLTLMLPWEGRMLFHPASAGRQLDSESAYPLPDRGSYYAYPRVIATSQYSLATNQGTFAGLGQIDITENSAYSSTISVTDITMEANPVSFFTPTFIEPEEFKSIQFMPESLVTDFDSFLKWNQIEPDSDGDGDGITAPREYFHGTNPYQRDEVQIDFEHLIDSETTSPFVRFTMPRSHLANGVLPDVFSGPDLNLGNYLLRSDVSSDTAPLDDDRDWLFLELPAEDAEQFFQLEFPD
ncbi:MAG: hypothetical protein Q7Q71_09130 [Verrucomicrobiota bacterium JB023]|nr:hypothetical protein [Verrucomicrobiota bacterium JB023]